MRITTGYLSEVLPRFEGTANQARLAGPFLRRGAICEIRQLLEASAPIRSLRCLISADQDAATASSDMP